MPNTNNLIPFHKGYDSRRQNGRKAGSKNVSTVVKELLDLEPSEITNDKIKSLVKKQNARSVKEAILSVAIIKSLNGDIRTTQWLFSYLDLAENINQLGLFNGGEIQITVVNPEPNKTVTSS